MTVTLFNDRPLQEVLDAKLRKITTRLHDWDPDALLNTPEHDVIETLIDEARVECPRLLRDQMKQLPAAETTRTTPEFGRPVHDRVPLLTFVVPYEGDQEVFSYRPSVWDMAPPRAAHLDTNDIHVTVEGPLGDAERTRQHLHAKLDKINDYLARASRQIEQHNNRVRSSVPDLVSNRRRELLKVRNIQAEIGIPLYRRADADTYSVPVKRRPIRARPSSSTETRTPFAPEPTLADEDYEAALKVLLHARNALERTPSVAAKLDEETLRDLLLIWLNAQFEGAAAGEVFNRSGKTDILIREGDRNVFIGECKIWKGPSTLQKALAQLLRYLAWRDTKAALLIFIRNKDVSAAIRSAISAVEAHPNYKRRGRHDDEERTDFVMHADGDPDREIHLALLPFALPGDATSRFNR